MTIVQTVLVFGGIPAGIIAVLAIGVFGRSAMHQPNRYRPGRPWNFAPTWYVPHPDALHGANRSSAVPHSDGVRTALTGASSTTATGGASGEW